MQTILNKHPLSQARRGRSARRGQTIIVALLVLLLIGFIGGVFVAIVTRTLQSSGRMVRVQSADFYAEAGIRFADQQLTTSLDGADWRPPLQFAVANPPAAGTLQGKHYASAVTLFNLTPAPANDPDKVFLDQGFTRYNIGAGRYLLRVTYDPVGLANQNNPTPGTAYSDPLTRYIKIESVGREGTIDARDPTTYRNAPPTRLNATLVQYKAIGITDQTRFETNPDNRSDVMALGTASTTDSSGNIVTPGTFDFDGGGGAKPALNQYPVVTTYGAQDAYIQDNTTGFLLPNPTAGSNTPPPSGANYTYTMGGGGIRANATVRVFGANKAYLSTAGTTVHGFNEGWQIAGNLLLDGYQPLTGDQTTLQTNQPAALILNSLTTAGVAQQNFAFPSNDVDPSTNQSRFITYLGQVRDSNSGTDANGQPRNINRLEPPAIDAINPVSSLPRFKDLTVNAAPRPYNGAAVTAANAASHGYGLNSIYVDNTNDIQRESSKIVGGYTLIDEWLHRDNAASSSAKGGWVANFYRPPGVDLTLGRQVRAVTTGTTPTYQTFYGVRLTRSDVDGAGNPIPWKYPTNVANDPAYVDTDWNTHQDLGSTLTVSYDELNAGHSLDPSALSGSGADTAAAYQANPNNDVVIYLEGNVRLHPGVVSVDPAEATGSGSTYVPTDANMSDDTLPRHITIVTNGTAYIDGSLLRGNPESTITILAHDYVCVNTTQFLAGTVADQNPNGTTAPGAYVGDTSLRALDFSASDEVLLQEFTLAGVPAVANNPLRLYISGGAGSAAGGTSADYDILDSRTGLNASAGLPLFVSNNASFGNGPVPYTAGAPAVPFSVSYSLSGTGQSELFRGTFQLPALASASSRFYQLGVRRSQGADSSGNPTGVNTEDYIQERAAVLPIDVRIEAVLFAQTKSFFVIPGEWFNTNTNDNLSQFANATTLTAKQRQPRPDIDVDDDGPNNNDVGRQTRFPFYGQPIDMKITISGAVSEARPADITAQSAWMGKWGWIPQFHGGLTGNGSLTPAGERAGHVAYKSDGTTPANTPATGLSIIYNPLAGYPYYGNHYMRLDLYGRALPFSPKLPVCAGLLYAGQNTTDQSSLQ